jgi:hypothetical protein
VDVLGADGTVETITGTTIHPVWSVDRQEWVPLAELTDGETLQGLDGLAVVLGVSLSRVSQPVYNIEVHGEHVYQVGELGLVVHNECVYRAFDAAGNVIYTGMTKSFPRRYAEHARRRGIEIVELVGDLTRDAARGVEQALIDVHKLGKDGGTLINKINSIATTNPKYKDLTEQGLKILKQLGIGY